MSQTLVLSQRSFGRNSLLILPSLYHSGHCSRRPAAQSQPRGVETRRGGKQWASITSSCTARAVAHSYASTSSEIDSAQARLLLCTA